MKHLRIALEGDYPSTSDSMSQLSTSIGALNSIFGDKGSGATIERASMESFFRDLPDTTLNERIEQFTVAMEDLSAGLWAALIAGIAAIAALIVKAIKFFTGETGSIEKAVTQFNTAKKEVDEKTGQLKQLDDAIRKEPVKVEDGKTFHSLQEIIDGTPALLNKYEQIMERHIDFLYGPADKNPFLHALKENEGFEEKMDKALAQSTKAHHEVTLLLLEDVDENNDGNIERYKNNTTKAKGIQIHHPYTLHGKVVTNVDVAKELNDAYRAANTKTSGSHTSIAEVNHYLEGYFQRDIVVHHLQRIKPIIDSTKPLTREMQESEELVKAIAYDTKKIAMREKTEANAKFLDAVGDGNRVMSKAFSEYAAGLKAVLSIAHNLVTFTNHLTNTQHEVRSLISQVVNEVKNSSMVSDNVRTLLKET